ncbi:type IV toxin-antitoxin system AbiEi family antitoxin domain-containing protein [Tsukamurella serpentis]
MDMGESQIRGILAAQDGVISRGQARESGLSAKAIDHRIARGQWRTVGRGVYLSAEHEFSDAARLRASVLVTGGIADGASALWWHGLIDGPPARWTVTVPRNRRTGPRFIAPLGVHRRDLLAADVETVHGVRVTKRPLTLLDAAGAFPDVTALLDRALQTGEVVPSALRAALDRNAGRSGMARARRIVDVVESDTESEAEREFAALMRAEGITGWVAQLVIGRYRADFAWPEERLVVEVDGWAFHRDAVRFQRDHDKRNAFARAGLTVLTFSWHDVVHDPMGTVGAVVDVLSDRRGAAS